MHAKRFADTSYAFVRMVLKMVVVWNCVSLIRQLVRWPVVKSLKCFPPLCKRTRYVHTSNDKRSKIMPGKLFCFAASTTVLLL